MPAARLYVNTLLWRPVQYTHKCAGKQVHDANVVATMLVQGVDTIVTINVPDFTRFDDRVRVTDLRLSA